MTAPQPTRDDELVDTLERSLRMVAWRKRARERIPVVDGEEET